MRIIIEIEEGRVTSTTVDGVPVGKGGDAATDASMTPPPDLLRRAAALGAASAGPATLRPEAGTGGGMGGALIAGPTSPADYAPAARPPGGNGGRSQAATGGDAGRSAIAPAVGAKRKSAKSGARGGGRGKRG